ncbi:MAG: cation diffusion facilitator family transporter [Halobacteria archaeon]|nr:cation diffusion facilitator family transporter [Halobacteria archaeon]
MGYSHDHDNGSSHESTRKLAIVSAINLTGFVVEFAGGLLFGSVALLSDAVHMLFDFIAYIMAFLAALAAERSDTSEAWSYGLHRLEPVSAFLNGVLLIPMVLYILFESYTRFLEPIEIDTRFTILVATAGLLINLISVYRLKGETVSLNEKGAFYHLLGDTAGSIAVIVSTTVIHLTGFRLIDPITAVLIAVFVVWSAGKLLRGSTEIFLERTPVSHKQLVEAVESVDGVKRVKDLHVRLICSHIKVASLHIYDGAENLGELRRIIRDVNMRLEREGIDHVTVEPLGSDSEYEESAYLDSHSH